MIRVEYSAIAESIASELASSLNTNRLKLALNRASKASTRGIEDYAIWQVEESFTASIDSLYESKYSRMRVINDEYTAELEATGKRLPLTAFKHNPEGITRRHERMTAEIERGVVKSRYPGFKKRLRGFLPDWHSGNLQIFQRKTKERTPLHMLRGASLSEMMSKGKVTDAIIRRMIRQYEEALKKEIAQ